MGFKQLVAVLIIIVFGAAIFIGGAEDISKKMEKYVEEKYKADPVNYEKYTFMNATYCNMTAKYARALEILDKYDARFYKEDEKEKSLFLRAKTLDNMLEARKAKIEYERYIQEFPEGPNIKKAIERQRDLKSYL